MGAREKKKEIKEDYVRIIRRKRGGEQLENGEKRKEKERKEREREEGKQKEGKEGVEKR